MFRIQIHSWATFKVYASLHRIVLARECMVCAVRSENVRESDEKFSENFSEKSFQSLLRISVCRSENQEQFICRSSNTKKLYS